MSLTTDIQTILQADEILVDLLPGGVQVGTEVNRQLTPGAFDANQELLACALVKPTTEIKSGPHSNSVQTTLSVFLYQRAGSDSIEAAALRIYNLLHEKHINGIWQILYSSETPVTTDEALNCPMIVQRYNTFRSKT